MPITASSDTKTIQAHHPRFLCSWPWLRSWCLAPGKVYFYFVFAVSFLGFKKTLFLLILRWFLVLTWNNPISGCLPELGTNKEWWVCSRNWCQGAFFSWWFLITSSIILVDWLYEIVGYAEQKVKVPSLHCDARVKTFCADVMNLPKHQVKALSPQVSFEVFIVSLLGSFKWIW